MTKWLSIGLEILGSFVLPLLAYLKGRGDKELEHEKRNIESIKDENARLRDRPRTHLERIERLRAWQRKLKDDGQ